MTTFDDREMTYENKFAHDEELRFKTLARRNKLFGLWVAEQLGKTGAAAEAYAKELVVAEVEHPGEEQVIAHAARDLATASRAIPTSTLRAQLNKLEATAKQQMMSEA